MTESAFRAIKIRILGLAKRTLEKGLKPFGYEIRKMERHGQSPWPEGQNLTGNIRKIHYACGFNMLAGWINADIDLLMKRKPGFYCLEVNLVGPHPFPDNWFDFGFCEDFIEHLTQADSLIFLCEVHRTFAAGGILRLSFPSLEGVLKIHYRNRSGYKGATLGKNEAYTKWEHAHFYSREELSLVCRQIGFSRVDFVEYGQSSHGPLQNLDHRDQQREINSYVEITK